MTETRAPFDREHGIIFPPKVRRSNYAYLFAGLSLLLLVGPAFEQVLSPSVSAATTTICFLGTIMIGIWTLIDSTTGFRIGLALAAIAIVSSCLEWWAEMPVFGFVQLGTVMAFLVLSIYHAGRDVIFTNVVDINRLVGAMCIYEMIGIMWALFYTCIVDYSSGAFADDALNASSSFFEFVYYSFVTLTTLGYGDITPAGSFTKALAYMEALVGQLYVAVLVAGLVGAHLAGRRQDKE